MSVCQPVFNQHTVSVCSTHITLTFLCTLNTLHSLLSSALPTTHFTEQTPKLFNFVYTLHLWNGCRKAKHIKGMKVDTRVPGISFSKKDLALENLAGVPHVCTPINCRCWFWHQSGKHSCCRRPCPPDNGRQLEILHTIRWVAVRVFVGKFWLWFKDYRANIHHIALPAVCNQFIRQCVYMAFFLKNQSPSFI